MEENVYTVDQPISALAKSSKGDTVLDRLRERLSEKVSRPEVLLEVPMRPGFKLRISPNITSQQMKNWRQRAGDGTKKEMDNLAFACFVVAGTTKGFVIDDEEVIDDDGVSLTFASPMIWEEILNASRPVPDGVRNLFVADPHVESAAVAILEQAGFGEDINIEDPTKGS